MRNFLFTVLAAIGTLAADAPIPSTATGRTVLVNAGTITGTGGPVLSTSPTIVTPTIASFANATHTHLDAAGGGTLSGAATANWTGSGTTNSTLAGNFLVNGGTATNGITLGGTGALKWTGGSQITNTADGKVLFLDSAGTAFTMLQFGGVGAANAALKIIGAVVQFKTASDSTYASVTAATFTTGANTIAAGRNGDDEHSSVPQVTWESGATIGAGSKDTGLKRGSAGVVKVTNGSTGYGGLDAGVVTATTSLSVGGGTAIASILSATATLDFPNILAAASADLTITVTGAAVSDSVALGLPAAPDASIVYNGFVSAANTVTVRAFNVGAIAVDPASGTYRATVHHY